MTMATPWPDNPDNFEFRALYADRWALTLVCRRFHPLAMPILYSHIALLRLPRRRAAFADVDYLGIDPAEDPVKEAMLLLRRSVDQNPSLGSLCTDLAIDMKICPGYRLSMAIDLAARFNKAKSLRIHNVSAGFDRRSLEWVQISSDAKMEPPPAMLEVDLTSFECLTFLSLSYWDTGCYLGESGLLAPRLQVFRWTFDERKNAAPDDALVLNHFQQATEDFLRRLAQAAVSRKCPLRNIEIVFTPTAYVGSNASGPGQWASNRDLEYPWDCMVRLAEEIHPWGIELTYNEPSVPREEFEAAAWLSAGLPQSQAEREADTFDLATMAQYFTLGSIARLAFGQESGLIRAEQDLHGHIAMLYEVARPMVVVSGVPYLRPIMRSSLVLRIAEPKPGDKKGLGDIGREIVRSGSSRARPRPSPGSSLAPIPPPPPSAPRCSTSWPRRALTGQRAGVFGPDGDLFRPERWLEAGEAGAGEMRRVAELVFGYGRSGCARKMIALLEMNKVLVELLRRFDFQLACPYKPWQSVNFNLFLAEG
ncbi:hypothetical protein VTK56DRAFT_4168 [Thermocarpiscus australiensis]